MLAAALTSLIASWTFFAALPATTNYQLNSYGFGSGGTANASTGNYALEGTTGELSGQTGSTTTYSAKPGFIETQQANVPQVTLSNPSSYYDKLKMVINQQGNPSDALYALQISTTSNFSSGNNYVKSDQTIGPTLTLADYQTYATWGGASGSSIIGLTPNTTYYLRAKATQGKYTESAYGSSSSAATVGASLSLCIYTNANCAAGGSSEAFASLLPATVTTSPTNIGIDFATNADFGGAVYVYSVNGGLRSSKNSYTMTSATANLSVVSEGFGAIVIGSPTASTGGPFNKISPYNGSSNNVGIVATTINTILSSSVPLTGGSAAVQLQAKASVTTPAATDYTETVVLIAAATF